MKSNKEIIRAGILAKKSLYDIQQSLRTRISLHGMEGLLYDVRRDMVLELHDKGVSRCSIAVRIGWTVRHVDKVLQEHRGVRPPLESEYFLNLTDIRRRRKYDGITQARP